MGIMIGSAMMLLMLSTPASAEDVSVLSLAGDWQFALDANNEGLAQHWELQWFEETLRLPGSLDQNGKGTANMERSRSYLSRLYEYVGPAWYQREIEVPPAWEGQSIELLLERSHWESRVWVDGRFAGTRDSLCAPHVYELGALTPGRHCLTLRVDNSVKYAVGLRAHSITEHTQTNWNGVIGRMELRARPLVSLGEVQIFPDAAARSAIVRATLRNAFSRPAHGRLTVSAAGASTNTGVEVPAGGAATAELRLNLAEDAPLWDEFNPRLIEVEVRLEAWAAEQSAVDTRRVSFGLRDFTRNGTQFALNDRPYFVRGTLECCIFPLTGYPAMDVQTWARMMATAKQYGLNHFRFHSWCPPEAAFVAADEAGVTLQVETPVWTDLGKFPDLDQFIRDEADRILAAYGNHPSFVMLAVGNEPSGPNKDAFLTGIVRSWQAQDPRRLYTTCAGWPELPVSDFHIVHERNHHPYRLHGGPLGPNTQADYRDVMAGCERPAIAHELGQWCVYPDYTEIPRYTGALRAWNLEGFRDSLDRNGMLDQAREFAWASGRLQRLLYKADIEALLRTPGAAGFQLLALQDFPGQGSALEGFLDAFWNSKGGVTPDEFRRFCSATVPLLRLEKLVWTQDETLHAQAEIAHFGPDPISHARPMWTARDAAGNEFARGEWSAREIQQGNGIALGEIQLPLRDLPAPAKLTLSVFLAGTTVENSWDIWVYPATPEAFDMGDVWIADDWSADVARRLHRGGRVLLLPKHLAPMRAVKSAFEPILWNTQWFPGQDRQLGVLCDPRHPALAGFPNDGHTDWQWWELLHGSSVMRLDVCAPDARPIIQVIDDWNKNRPLAAVFEARVGRGRLLVSTLDIESDLEHRPAARALRASLLHYMNSEDFAPREVFDAAWLREALAPGDSVIAQVEADAAEANHPPEDAVDGNPATYWQAPAAANGAGIPHELRLYLQEETELVGLSVLRPDAPDGAGRYAVYTARDGRNWSAALSEGESVFGAQPQEIRFSAPVRTRWLRIVFTSEAQASVAEIIPVLSEAN